jgi:hypothetical protein
VANLEIGWTITKPIRLFDEARELGFDLRHHDNQPEDIQAFMRKSTVDRVVNKLRETWRDDFDDGPPTGRDFGEIRNGVYVIAIGDGFGVSYRKGCSEVMYIGRGRIANRLRSHLTNWIFDMSRSLRDVPFRFYMQSVGDGRSKDAFKDFERHLLEQFARKFGEKPLINKIHGRTGTAEHNYDGNWSAPIDNRGKRYMWQIRPSSKNEWFKQYEDE